MHWIVPFAGSAAWGGDGARALQGLQSDALVGLRGLIDAAGGPEGSPIERVLPAPAGPDASDAPDPALSFTPPHERALAQAIGLDDLPDGAVPLGGLEAARAGLPADGRTWARLSLSHWHLGTEQVSMRDPDELELDEASSRTFLEALRPLLEGDGYTVLWRTPTLWLLSHPQLQGLACASLDRVVGRNVDPWLGASTPDPRMRRVRRLQNEVQMLLHTHPMNAERESRGALTVNSFWLDGCGPVPEAKTLRRLEAVRVDTRLRAPGLRGDQVAWISALHSLDEEVLRPALEAARRGEPMAVTLCGERFARTLRPGPARGLLGRLRRWLQPTGPDAVARWLESL